jgi:glycerophosphoryl diester phosphodiesterase
VPTWSRRAGIVVVAALLAALGVSFSAGATRERPPARASADGPIVVGHRGASAYRPEHTIAAYELAVAMGADYIEPDLVATKDGALVARHENDISETTDVAEHGEFAARRTTKVIDGTSHTGWFTEDFTLAELKTLRATERRPDLRPSNTALDGRYEVPTLQEVIDLAEREGVGLYPETKHPTYFDGLGLSLEEPLLRALRRNGLDRRGAKVFIQSFETANLKELDEQTELPLVQLIGSAGAPADLVAAGDRRTYDDLVTREGLDDIAEYADGIGPAKKRIVPWDAEDRLGEPTTLIADAHARGLLVHPFTFRPENEFLPADLRRGDPDSPQFGAARGDHPAELALFYRLGVDGLFADSPDTAVAVRATLGRPR